LSGNSIIIIILIKSSLFSRHGTETRRREKNPVPDEMIFLKDYRKTTKTKQRAKYKMNQIDMQSKKFLSNS
jgi:hypothetical protein